MSRQSAPRRITADVAAVNDTGCDVLHLDMDAFFAEVALQRRPELRGRPMMVAGTGPRAVVLSATYEARAFGVRSAMPVGAALAACPGVIAIPPDHAAYRAMSARVMALLAATTPFVEQVSIDEAFLGVHGVRRTIGRPAVVAQYLRQRIKAQLGLVATVGVAANKFLAKLASSLAKPDGLLVVPVAEVATFLAPLPVEALWGVGPHTRDRLVSLGLVTIGDLAARDVPYLARIVGRARAVRLHELAHGRDERRITPHRDEVSIGAEQTFDVDVSAENVLQRTLLDLVATTTRRVRQAGMVGRVAVLKVRFDDFTTVTRSETLPTTTDQDRDVLRAVRHSWERLARGQRPVRLLGVRLESLLRRDRIAQQLELPIADDQRQWADAQVALDVIAARFGAAAPKPASLLAEGDTDPPATRAAAGPH